MIFPSSNTELLSRAIDNGYVYTGRTLIRLNSDGTITTRNPNRNSGNSETRPLPNNGVLYVSGNTDSGFNPNGSNRFNIDMGNVFVSGVLQGQLTIGAQNSIFIAGRDPTNYTYSTATVFNGVTYAGTGFTLDTNTGITTVTGGAQDILGLVANNSVYIMTNGWPSGTSPFYSSLSSDTSTQNIQVHAAIFAINQSFANESCYQANGGGSTHAPALPDSSGNTVNLIVLRVALIQQTRGVVGFASGGTITSGYDKSYAHDPRMQFSAPPYFTDPVNSGWGLISWRED